MQCIHCILVVQRHRITFTFTIVPPSPPSTQGSAHNGHNHRRCPPIRTHATLHHKVNEDAYNRFQRVCLSVRDAKSADKNQTQVFCSLGSREKRRHPSNRTVDACRTIQWQSSSHKRPLSRHCQKLRRLRLACSRCLLRRQNEMGCLWSR